MAGIRRREWLNKNGTKRFCYEITYYINGKQCRKSGYKTKLDAQADLQAVTNTVSSDITFYNLVKEYIKSRQYRCKDSTIELYEKYLRCNLRPLHKLKARDVKSRDIDKIVLQMKQNGITNKTINCILLFMRSVYNYAILNKWVHDNPAKLVNTLPKVAKQKQALSEAEIKEFLSFIDKYPINKKTPLILALYSGIRIGELLAIEWTDIDFINNRLYINKQVSNKRVTTPKTFESTRYVNIPPEVVELLKRLKSESVVLSKIVFCSDSGGYIRRDKFIEHWFKKAMRHIGHPDYTFHCLRHTYATYLLSNNIPVKYVQEQLGHTSAQTTLNVYNHVLKSTNQQAINLLENLNCEHKMSIDLTRALKKPTNSGLYNGGR